MQIHVAPSLVFSVVFSRPQFVFVIPLPLSVMRFTNTNYRLCIIKLFICIVRLELIFFLQVSKTSIHIPHQHYDVIIQRSTPSPPYTYLINIMILLYLFTNSSLQLNLCCFFYPSTIFLPSIFVAFQYHTTFLDYHYSSLNIELRISIFLIFLNLSQ